MNLKNAFQAIRIFTKEEALTTLTTPWGESLDPTQVLQEYPRPQMVRNSYINLNGFWQYAITRSPSRPKAFEGDILVPFSPESHLSGVHRQLLPDEFLWYETKLPLSQAKARSRCLLHFGAVDQQALVLVNGHIVTRHTGGYLPFEADITEYLTQGDNILTVRVQDFSDTSVHSRGKQRLKRGGMFYTAQSGIWQTVWLEWVPETYISALTIRPDYDHSSVHIKVHSNKSDTQPLTYEIKAGDKTIYQCTTLHSQVNLPVPDKIDWSPENPFLYDLEVRLEHDYVQSYFGMRTFTIQPDIHQIPRLCLNHQPIFLHGVLDQGYWPDGLYTAPSDQALIYDIEKMKSLGFNLLRKHIKVESARWYYHCDRLGMVVWQDMVNGGTDYNTSLVTWLPTLLPWTKTHMPDNLYSLFSRRETWGRRAWLKECEATVKHLSHFCSISTWVPFNEGWGQFDTRQVTALIRRLDKDRLIDSASGWFDQSCGDFKSSHNYFSRLTVTPDKRAFVLSEYGGYACRIPNHSSVQKVYGYKIFATPEAFRKDFYRLMEEELYPLVKQGLCAAVFTQLSDVEEEVNGLLTYDRKVCKLDSDTL